jgi:hypothetical protein
MCRKQADSMTFSSISLKDKSSPIWIKWTSHWPLTPLKHNLWSFEWLVIRMTIDHLINDNGVKSTLNEDLDTLLNIYIYNIEISSIKIMNHQSERCITWQFWNFHLWIMNFFCCNLHKSYRILHREENGESCQIQVMVCLWVWINLWFIHAPF